MAVALIYVLIQPYHGRRITFQAEKVLPMSTQFVSVISGKETKVKYDSVLEEMRIPPQLQMNSVMNCDPNDENGLSSYRSPSASHSHPHLQHITLAAPMQRATIRLHTPYYCHNNRSVGARNNKMSDPSQEKHNI